MSGNRRAQVHFDANLGGTRGWQRNDREDPRRGGRKRGNRDQSVLAEALYRARYDDDDDGYVGGLIGDDDEDVGFEDMKILQKRKGVKAISSGKVLNTGRKKYRRWRRHDKGVLKDMITPGLNDMIAMGELKKRKAKKVRKQFVKRVLSCFYAKDKKD